MTHFAEAALCESKVLWQCLLTTSLHKERQMLTPCERNSATPHWGTQGLSWSSLLSQVFSRGHWWHSSSRSLDSCFLGLSQPGSFSRFFFFQEGSAETWDWRFLLKAALFSSVYSSVAIYFTKNSCSEQSGSAVAWYKGILFKTKPLQQIGLKYQNIQIFMCVSNKQYNVSYILL